MDVNTVLLVRWRSFPLSLFVFGRKRKRERERKGEKKGERQDARVKREQTNRERERERERDDSVGEERRKEVREGAIRERAEAYIHLRSYQQRYLPRATARAIIRIYPQVPSRLFVPSSPLLNRRQIAFATYPFLLAIPLLLLLFASFLPATA